MLYEVRCHIRKIRRLCTLFLFDMTKTFISRSHGMAHFCDGMVLAFLYIPFCWVTMNQYVNWLQKLVSGSNTMTSLKRKFSTTIELKSLVDPLENMS